MQLRELHIRLRKKEKANAEADAAPAEGAEYGM